MRFLLVALLALIALAHPAKAGVCGPYPFTFTNNTVASGVQVMSNFNWILGCQNATATGGTFTGPVYFKSGQPWVDVAAFGCVGDSVTDNTACMQSAINALEANYFSGIVYLPPANGFYCIKTRGGVTLHNRGMSIIGASRVVTLAACGVDSTVVTLTATQQRLEHLSILGANAPGAPTTGVFGSAQPALAVTSGGVNVIVDDVTITGGKNAISLQGADATLDNVTLSSSYGSAVLYLANNGSGMFHRVSVDQGSPAALPAYPYTISAHATTHTYVTGDIVSMSGYLVQYTTGGTSASSAPALANYGVTVNDGSTAQFQLLGPSNYSGIQVDTGSFDTYMDQMDITGPYAVGLNVSNTLSGASPTFVKCSQCLPSQFLQNGIDINAAGTEVVLSDITSSGGIVPASSGLIATNTFAGTLTITGGNYTGGAYGVALNGGAAVTVTGTIATGGTDSLISTASDFVMSGNVLLGGGTGVSASGTIDHYNIVNNICAGVVTCVSDSGSGSHKTVSGNN